MSKGKILLVDDDPDLVEAMRLVLEGNGYECVHAPNGTRAIEAIPKEKPDLMVLDVMMDDLTEGFHVAYKIRKPEAGLEPFRGMPIIMLTAIGQRTGMKFDQKADADFLPVDEFMEKPVQPKELLAKVAHLLSRARGGRPAN
ncbi:MAG: response regulator transcription factor [Candidatus Eisenbacteria bacterium]|nr:response regulator transcription factor [Candidatus Eisenbacteria bacterium]